VKILSCKLTTTSCHQTGWMISRTYYPAHQAEKDGNRSEFLAKEQLGRIYDTFKNNDIFILTNNPESIEEMAPKPG
jgi:hypothetical protein